MAPDPLIEALRLSARQPENARTIASLMHAIDRFRRPRPESVLSDTELAAHEALRALEHGGVDAHIRLAAARRREFSNKWRFNRTLRSLVASPFAVRAAAMGARVTPAWLHHTIRYAGDLRAA